MIDRSRFRNLSNHHQQLCTCWVLGIVYGDACFRGYLGTFLYASPEVFLGVCIGRRRATIDIPITIMHLDGYQCDLWALGVILVGLVVEENLLHIHSSVPTTPVHYAHIPASIYLYRRDPAQESGCFSSLIWILFIPAFQAH